jgi:acetolactate synthase-1/2/3 large subunit
VSKTIIVDCLSTLGPGATNLVTAAAHAFLGGMPMLMITGQKPVLQSRQAQFQIIDTVSMMRPLTKSAKQVIDAGNIPTLVRMPFAWPRRSGKQGICTREQGI